MKNWIVIFLMLIIGLFFYGLTFRGVWGDSSSPSAISAFAAMGVFSIICLMLIVISCRQIYKLPLWASLLAAVIFGFATTAWSYAFTINDQVLSVLFLLLIFYSAFRYRQSRDWAGWWSAIVGSCYAIVIAIDYLNAILFLPVVVYFMSGMIKVESLNNKFKVDVRPSVLVAISLFLVISFADGYYNYQTFGDWRANRQPVTNYRNNPEVNAVSSARSATLQEEVIFNRLPSLVYQPDRGLFFFSPVLILGVLGFFMTLKRQALAGSVLMATVITNLLIYSSMSDASEVWSYGPGNLIPTMVALAILTAYYLVHTSRKLISLGLFYLLFVYSSGVALLGALTANLVPSQFDDVSLNLSNNSSLLNIEQLKQGQSGSLIFLNYFANSWMLIDYYLFIYLCLLLIGLLLVICAFIGERKHALYA